MYSFVVIFQEGEQKAADAQVRGKLEMLTQLTEEQKVCIIIIIIIIIIIMFSLFMSRHNARPTHP